MGRPPNAVNRVRVDQCSTAREVLDQEESMLESWIADAHFAMRRLRARPSYAWLAVLTLGLGVAGTASTYSVARECCSTRSPTRTSARSAFSGSRPTGGRRSSSYIRGRVPGFREVALYRLRDMILREGDDPARLVPGVASSAELFQVLGVRPALGRGFQPNDDALGAEPVAVLSDGLWRELGSDRAIVGKRLTVDGTPRTVVGVMPRGFWFPDPTVRIWTPVPLNPQSPSWNSTLVGRVAPGHDVRAMAAPVARLSAMLDERFDYPAQWDKTKDAHITPVRDALMGDMRPALVATLGAMALIFLIACANVAALMLGQVEARFVEFAVRSALGASRRRLTRQLIVEDSPDRGRRRCGWCGARHGGIRLVVQALPLGAWGEVTTPDWGLFASALMIAVIAALLVALVPTVSLWRGDLRGVLGRVRTGGFEGRGGRLENGLVVAEVALAVVITSGAALLTRSVTNLYAIDPRVRTDGVAVVDVAIRARQRETVNDLIAALAGPSGCPFGSGDAGATAAWRRVQPCPSPSGAAPDVQGMTTGIPRRDSRLPGGSGNRAS
jgi:predicted permease